jgi:hypothetical protein
VREGTGQGAAATGGSPAPPPAAPAAAAPAIDAADNSPRKTKMVAPTDGLSLADRIAKRQADEKKLADELAGEEKKRLLSYDKTEAAAPPAGVRGDQEGARRVRKAKSKETSRRSAPRSRRRSTPRARR